MMKPDFIEQLNFTARVLRNARMLPIDQPLTDEQRAAVRADFNAYIRAKGLYLSQVGREIGQASSTISQWASGKYPADPDPLTRKINRWMESHARKEQANLPCEYVPTTVAEGLRTMAMLAHSRRSMAVAVMPSGTGKTMVLTTLTEELLGWYIYCHQALTPREFLIELAQTVGASTSSPSTANLLRRIVEKVKGTGRPILLDEAHQLQTKVFGLIRTIHDLTGSAIIMAGTFEIIERVNDTANARGQIASRTLRYNAMSAYFNTGDPGSSGADPLFTRREIKALFAKTQVRFDHGGFEIAWAIACLMGEGCLRTVRKIVELVLERWPGDVITRDRMIEALPLHFAERARFVERKAIDHIEHFKRRSA